MDRIFDTAAITGAIFTAALFWHLNAILAFVAAPAGGLIAALVVVASALGVRHLRTRVLAIRNSPSRKPEAIPPGVVWC